MLPSTIPRIEVVLTTLLNSVISKSLGKKDVWPSADKILDILKQEIIEIKIVIIGISFILKKVGRIFLINSIYIRKSFF